MDVPRFQKAYERLESLDERMTHQVRPRPGGSLTRPTQEILERQLRTLAAYTVELQQVVHELFLAIAGRSSESEDSGE